MDYGQFYEKPFRPLDTMSKDDLKAELLNWRNLWTWLDPNVSYWLTKVGQTVRVSLRNGTNYKGRLGAVQYNPTMLVVECTERIYNYMSGDATYETKTVTLKITDMVSYDVIEHEEVAYEPVTAPLQSAVSPEEHTSPIEL